MHHTGKWSQWPYKTEDFDDMKWGLDFAYAD